MIIYITTYDGFQLNNIMGAMTMIIESVIKIAFLIIFSCISILK